MVLRNIADLAQHRFNNDSEVTARIGGEEFAVLIPDLSLEQVDVRVQQFMDDLASQTLSYLSKKLPNVSVSVGIAIYDQNGQSLTDLIREADHAMYEAKKAGRNRYAIAQR